MHTILKKYFGYNDFRPLQQEIINDVLSKKDVFVLMPTGGGKSLCYQIPAIMLGGLTVVVSPLISLMKDQVDSLVANGVNAAYLNSTLTSNQTKDITRSIIEGRINVVYVAPERLVMGNMLKLLKYANVSLFAIDEVHCISEWGHDFRPEYRRLNIIRKNFPDVPVIALTATATPRVREDTIEQLALRSPSTYVASFDRRNLSYSVRPKKEVYDQIVSYLRKQRGKSGIIYCTSRKDVERISSRLNKDGFNTLPYHAGLSDSVRSKHQERFIRDDVDIIVATVAFGMGIDKPDVRFVIHHDLPKNLESYYQETGRGGRDGLECECILFFTRGDWYRLKYFIDQKNKKQERDIASRKVHQMMEFCEITTCRRKYLLSYFGEQLSEDNCGACDVCLNPPEVFDATLPARELLQCVEEAGQRFGLTHIVSILSGSRSQKILSRGHDKLSMHGRGKQYTKDQWSSMAREMVRKGILDIKGDRYPVLELNPTSYEVLSGSLKVELSCAVPLPKKSGSTAKPEPTGAPVHEVPAFACPAGRVKSVRSVPTAKAVQNKPSGDLFKALRELRLSIARAENVPPYIVFADTSLRQMVSRMPSTNSELLEITGVGEYKLKKYGNLFLKKIEAFR